MTPGLRMAETLRAFIALPLPAVVRDHLMTLRERLLPYHFPLRWVPPENVHLTLKFLGDIPHDAVPALTAAMETAGRDGAPLSLAAKGIGVFPSVKKARVVWAGLKGETEALIRFQATLDEALAETGIPPETRPFRAHLTLARTKGRLDPEPLTAAMAELAGIETESFAADEMVLFRSKLSPRGATYSRVATAPLGGDQSDVNHP